MTDKERIERLESMIKTLSQKVQSALDTLNIDSSDAWAVESDLKTTEPFTWDDVTE